MLSIYHGSERIIEKPEFGAGKENNDFGKGFYCTESEELAKEWAVTSQKDGYANRYSIDIFSMNILHLNSPDYTILNWISVLVQHRLFRPRTPIAGRALKYLREYFAVDVDAYDIITGYRADDSYFDFADAFLNNGITVEQLSEAMRLGKLGEQIVIKSAYAFEQLRFEGADFVHKEQYHPIRKARNEKAEKDYLELSLQETDGLYMADIIREKVKNDDPRIPGNISG